MKTNYHKMWKVTLTMMLGVLMAACSDDEVQDLKGSRELHLVMGTQKPTDVTRALPVDYLTYSAYNTVGTELLLPLHAEIKAFLATQGTDEPIRLAPFSFTDDTNSSPVHRSWSTRVKIDDPNKTYYLYGFMPSEEATSVSIEPYDGDYKKGAKLGIKGINAITPNDICVIVGVQGYTRPDDQTPLPSIEDNVLAMNTRLGKFDIKVPGEENYAYLLVDHIFCNFKFRMKIDEQYSQLRTIKVKQMKLTASTDGSQLVKSVDVKVTLQHTDDNTSPIASIVIDNYEMGSSVSDPAMLYDESEHKVNNNPVPLTLTTDPKDLRGYLAPAVISSDPSLKFELETTYDVYDRKGNRIRENEVATNTFKPAETLNPGEEYTFNIIVTPTYLYRLGEQDLDSPSFTIN